MEEQFSGTESDNTAGTANTAEFSQVFLDSTYIITANHAWRAPSVLTKRHPKTSWSSYTWVFARVPIRHSCEKTYVTVCVNLRQNAMLIKYLLSAVTLNWKPKLQNYLLVEGWLLKPSFILATKLDCMLQICDKIKPNLDFIRKICNSLQREIVFFSFCHKDRKRRQKSIKNVSIVIVSGEILV